MVKLVASNENSAAILGDLLADGIRSLNNLFFGRIDPLGGFQKIMNPAPGEIIGGEVDSPYDAQMLQAMPTLGISTILSAGGVEPRVQEDGGVQASEVTGDDIKDAVLEWVQNMGTDLLYDDRLAEVINVVLADLMGADGSKLGTTVQDGKEMCIRDRMLKLLYPRFYVHEYDEDQHAMYQQIFDEDYIGSSLWRIGSSLGGLLTDTMVYDFPDSVLYKFLNKYQVVEDIANPGFFNALTSFIGDMMNDEEIKVLKAGYFAEDIKDTIANVHTDLKLSLIHI